MPRRRRLRKVVAPPHFKGYRPYGCPKSSNTEAIELLYEEYEALKLADYDLLNHQEAARLMGISRPTFARIYESARRKIAQTLVETKSLKTVYGHAQLDKNWFYCPNCHARFTIPAATSTQACPVCRSENCHPIDR